MILSKCSPCSDAIFICKFKRRKIGGWAHHPTLFGVATLPPASWFFCYFLVKMSRFFLASTRRCSHCVVCLAILYWHQDWWFSPPIPKMALHYITNDNMASVKQVMLFNAYGSFGHHRTLICQHWCNIVVSLLAQTNYCVQCAYLFNHEH